MAAPVDLDGDAPDVEMELNTSLSTILKEEIDLAASTVRLAAPSENRSASPPSSLEYVNPLPFKGNLLPGLPPSSPQSRLLPLTSSSTINIFNLSTGRDSSKSTPPELMMGSASSKSLYPSLNPSMLSIETVTSDSLSIPGTFPEPPARSYPTYALSSPKPSELPANMNPGFTFRFPLPKAPDSHDEKNLARTAVLAELRRRMTDEPGFTASATLGEPAMPALTNGAKKRGREDEDDESSDHRAEASAISHATKFDRAHRRQFDKCMFYNYAVHPGSAHPPYPQNGVNR